MEAIRKRLIISADDFGLNKDTNNNILSLAEEGHLDRVAVLVHGKISPEESARLKNSGVKLDVHLDIPRLNIPEKNVLGRLFFFILRYIFGQNSPTAIEKSWEKQIEKFDEIFGQYPDGINSHQHIHFFPPYFKKALVLRERFAIPFFRFGKESILFKKGIISLILRILRKWDKEYITSSATLDSADFLVSLDWIKKPQEFLRHLVPGTTEIVCHPERSLEYETIKKYFHRS